MIIGYWRHFDNNLPVICLNWNIYEFECRPYNVIATKLVCRASLPSTGRTAIAWSRGARLRQAPRRLFRRLSCPAACAHLTCMICVCIIISLLGYMSLWLMQQKKKTIKDKINNVLFLLLGMRTPTLLDACLIFLGILPRCGESRMAEQIAGASMAICWGLCHKHASWHSKVIILHFNMSTAVLPILPYVIGLLPSTGCFLY